MRVASWSVLEGTNSHQISWPPVPYHFSVLSSIIFSEPQVQQLFCAWSRWAPHSQLFSIFLPVVLSSNGLHLLQREISLLRGVIYTYMAK